MPSLTITQNDLISEGPRVEVLFWISSDLEKKYKTEGKVPPTAIKKIALIDTGASHCAIQANIPEQLGLKPVGTIKITTPSCKDKECYRYFMRMAIPSHRLEYEGLFTAVPLEGQNIECLIGRDALAEGILIYIGYINQFTFSVL
jgi:predicted aspartyl protease